MHIKYNYFNEFSLYNSSFTVLQHTTLYINNII